MSQLWQHGSRGWAGFEENQQNESSPGQCMKVQIYRLSSSMCHGSKGVDGLVSPAEQVEIGCPAIMKF